MWVWRVREVGLIIKDWVEREREGMRDRDRERRFKEGFLNDAK